MSGEEMMNFKKEKIEVQKMKKAPAFDRFFRKNQKLSSLIQPKGQKPSIIELYTEM